MANITVLGEAFEVQDGLSAWAYNDFAKATQTEGDAESPKGYLAMMALIEDCIVPDDWARFEAHTREKRASFDQLLAVVTDMVAAAAERPTGRPADSTAGPSPTLVKSGRSAGDKASEMWPGRPDLQLMAVRAEAAS